MWPVYFPSPGSEHGMTETVFRPSELTPEVLVNTVHDKHHSYQLVRKVKIYEAFSYPLLSQLSSRYKWPIRV